jgi:50S ribosomal protein L16 3-hydroxylase
MARNKNPKIGLSALLSPKSAQDFFSTAWPEKPFVVENLSESISAFTSLPFLQSLDAMLAVWPHSVQVHLPDVSDEASSIDVSASAAKKLFDNHLSLLFNQAERLSPVLKDWLSAVQAELGLPAMTYARCMVYATPDGKGTAPHFDQNINFVLQLTGTKKWWVAKNENVTHPSERHTAGLPVHSELASYAKLPFPKSMPSHQKSIVLKPGSLLFVPQGYWHSTEAKGEALSLNFTFSQPSYADLFLAALRSRLLLSPEWRECATGVSPASDASPAKVSRAQQNSREMAEAHLDLLLAELALDIPEWKAADIFGATEG